MLEFLLIHYNTLIFTIVYHFLAYVPMSLCGKKINIPLGISLKGILHSHF